MKAAPKIHIIAAMPASIHSITRFTACLLIFSNLIMKKSASFHYHSTNTRAPSQLIQKTIYGLIKDHPALILEFWNGITEVWQA